MAVSQHYSSILSLSPGCGDGGSICGGSVGSNSASTENTLMSSNELMSLLGYKDRGSFWSLVYGKGIPHIRLNARVIKFERSAVDDWLRQRNTNAA